jgi:methylated-DNA-protein-cysteine methyltransferase-like protein|tara:strand:- start:1224 stop:1625 length:402 start_codon:yes stop_codon:yes gene_type:complete
MSSATESFSVRHQTIYEVVKTIPVGVVATYGQVAAIVGCGPRLVGYALASLPAGMDVPWQRVINSQGKISTRSDGAADPRQRQALIREGIVFSLKGTVDLKRFGWDGPDWDWLYERGLQPPPRRDSDASGRFP